MSLRTSFVLMILFIVLGTFAIFDPLRRAEKEDAKRDRESHVVWLKDKLLDGLAVAGKNPPMTLECTLKEGCPFDGTGEWKMTAPVADQADASAAGTLASSILNLTQNDKIDLEGAPDQAEFGFDHPQAEVTLKVRGEAQPIVLKFGKPSPMGQNVYLSVNSEPRRVFLVPAYLPEMINRDTFHWRNKRLFPKAEAAAVSRLGWKTPKLEVRAYRLKDKWRLEFPSPATAGQVMVEGLASTVAYLTAKSVFSPSRDSPEGKKALAGKPALEIIFALTGGDGHKLQLFAKPSKKEYVAAVDKQGTLYNLDAVAFDRFTKEMLEYRERTLIDEATRAAVAAVRFTFPREKREINFRLESGKWVYSSGERLPEALSQERVNGFLDSLRDGEFKAFFPAKGASPEAKAFRSQPHDLYMEIKNAKDELLLQTSFLVHDRRAALTEREGDVRTLAESFLKTLPVRLTDLTESANKQVVVKPEEKASPDGHRSQPEPEPRH